MPDRVECPVCFLCEQRRTWSGSIEHFMWGAEPRGKSGRMYHISCFDRMAKILTEARTRKIRFVGEEEKI